MEREIKKCAECESDFYSDTSAMEGLCPECSHHLYGHINCDHRFENGRCTKCNWNGISSDYINKLKKTHWADL